MSKEKSVKTLVVSKTIPKDAVILLIDVQEKYFDCVLEEMDDPIARKKKQEDVLSRLNNMAAKLTSLKKDGHKIYAVIDEEGIHPVLKDIPDVFLPHWEYKKNPTESSIDSALRFDLHPEIINELKGADTVLVCGLWLEMCVMSVARLLSKEQFKVITSIDPVLSLENAMIWDDDDVITLESECESLGVKIIEVYEGYLCSSCGSPSNDEVFCDTCNKKGYHHCERCSKVINQSIYDEEIGGLVCTDSSKCSE